MEKVWKFLDKIEKILETFFEVDLPNLLSGIKIEKGRKEAGMRIHPLPVVVAILIPAGVIFCSIGDLWIGVAAIVIAFLISLGVATGFFARISEMWHAIYLGYP